MEMNDLVREQMLGYAKQRDLTESQGEDLLRMFELFGKGAEIHPDRLAPMMEIDLAVYMAFLEMVATSLHDGYSSDPSPMTLKDLIKSTFAVGVAFGITIEGGLRHG